MNNTLSQESVALKFFRSHVCLIAKCWMVAVSFCFTVTSLNAENVSERGGNPHKNNVSSETGLPVQWDVDSEEGVAWSKMLGTVTYGTPVVSDGNVYVATNNGAAYLKKYPAEIDLGCLVCFEEKTGEFIWQLSRPKLEAGDVHDWAFQGICSDPLVEGDRAWVVTNRGEVLCLDTAGFTDGENDGPVKDEVDHSKQDADIVWKLDMISQLGVLPRNMTACSVTGAGDLIFVGTSNGVAETENSTEEQPVPAPEAPSFLAINKKTGNVVWSDNSPGKNLLYGQWSSPAYGVFDGQAQVIFAGGDGWCYSFDPAGTKDGQSKLLWKFDCNIKSSTWDPLDEEGRNNLIATPVIYKNIVYLGVGQDPEIGDGPGCLWTISPMKRGDVSSTLVVDANGKPVAPRRVQALDETAGEKEIANPNSAVVWKFTGEDRDKNGTLDFEETMSRTISSVTIQDDILIVGTLSGLVHCLDAKTGKSYWVYDMFSLIWGGALIADGKIYLGDEDGDIAVFHHSADPEIAMPEGAPVAEINMGAPIYTTPIAVNGKLYISTSDTLFAIEHE